MLLPDDGFDSPPPLDGPSAFGVEGASADELAGFDPDGTDAELEERESVL
ncbi:MAG TPA: hypothetical protein VFH90_03315 [Candidatus Limnocylindria bacterium]|nr:hypothetical protein [Candidatus Limnocylindria bacterium]